MRAEKCIRRRDFRLLLLALVMLFACTKSTDDAARDEAVNGTAAEDPVSPRASGQTGGLPNDRTPAEGRLDARSPQAAAQVLQQYFALIEAARYADAYRLWWDGGRASGMSLPEFGGSFTRYREYHAEIGAPGAIEGAAGSAYVDVPVQLYGRLMSGEPFSARDTMTLRRANDVPGSTVEQRQWRIYRSDLRPPAAPAHYRFVGRWATEKRNCRLVAWRFTANSLTTPAGSVCRFAHVRQVPGGYDVAARCTAEGPPTDDTLKLRFAESAKALLFESDVIADAGLIRCP
jgi:hypothetical protein